MISMYVYMLYYFIQPHLLKAPVPLETLWLSPEDYNWFVASGWWNAAGPWGMANVENGSGSNHLKKQRPQCGEKQQQLECDGSMMGHSDDSPMIHQWTDWTRMDYPIFARRQCDSTIHVFIAGCIPKFRSC